MLHRKCPLLRVRCAAMRLDVIDVWLSNALGPSAAPRGGMGGEGSPLELKAGNCVVPPGGT